MQKPHHIQKSASHRNQLKINIRSVSEQPCYHQQIREKKVRDRQ